MMVISPDEGGMGRAIYIANVLGLDMGMFYKRRDYTRIVNGRNPIVAHEFLGTKILLALRSFRAAATSNMLSPEEIISSIMIISLPSLHQRSGQVRQGL